MPSTELELVIAASIDATRIESDLGDLVRAPSVTGREEGIQLEIVARLEEADIPVERITPTPEEAAADPDWPGAEMPRASLPIVVARVGRPGGRKILLVGHVDVVPPGDPALWSTDPWGGEVRDGRLYGRGACDMKGGVVAILEAMRALRGVADRVDLHGEVVAAFVPSEEDGGQGMLAAIRAGVAGDVAIVTEPTGLDVVVAHAGAITFRLAVPGRAAHAAQRRDGVSALDKLFILARALEADEGRRNADETHPLMTALGLPYPTVIGTIEGGEWASTVPDRVVVEGRYGVRLGQTWRDAEADLRTCIAEACAADPFLRDHPASVEITGGRFSSAEIPIDHPLPTGLATAVADVTGRPAALVGVPYGADMRLLIHHAATPTVIFGPGHVRVAHAVDEYVPLDQVSACARVLAVWALRQVGG